MRGGRRPGTPKTGGRVKGVPNKAKRELREIAQQYTAEAVETLAHIMRSSESEPARVSAANALLDRGHGKPAQTLHATHEVIKDPAELADVDLAHIASAGRNGVAVATSGSPESRKLH